MSSLLNTARPPVFCPGCSHDRIVRALDQALEVMGIAGNQVVLVSDIGCSGLFDVFFHTHAFHGLHGRALTYALGLKMARPELHVIVTMGDGGMGIGGAHILSACRRNADLTLLVLNNFNFGMTGGQYSSTTPVEATTSSRFLNQLEQPLDICWVAEAAGAPFVMRCSGLEKELVGNMVKALEYKGFSVMDIWGICPGRYTRKNSISPKNIQEKIAAMRSYTGVVAENERGEYVKSYREAAEALPQPQPLLSIKKQHTPPSLQKSEILVLGSAGQRIVTAGELLCLASLSGGLQATQKNDYDITVLKGPSVSEIILWPKEIGYTGIEKPDIILVISDDGVKRRRQAFSRMDEGGLVIYAAGVTLPACRAEKLCIDFREKGLASHNWALAALGVLARLNRVITSEMLETAIRKRFAKANIDSALETLRK
ncbi:thiamine pyrophosphate-dependent enzyme [Desulfopila inferna]|uniref:thiamine pyrophosphate-dependent enzyme n=1 Tax=Desulfopila inferna TaxID=468528 RepID=UPI0019643A35|nr:thiamine pyrophosphate-dependent enzyme [Desulfopila inferna]MBM9603413.1 2-oxoacid:acceptor oxidoreductase family protein [Desulfopila inferna]